MKISLIFVICLLSACVLTQTIRPETQGLNAGMQLSETTNHGFVMTSFQRVQDASAPIRIYIEGDGFAWITRNEPSTDPTPKNALALKLAMLDSSQNVIYLARPCQYSLSKSPSCKPAYWTDERFSPKTIQLMNDEIDSIMSIHPHQKIELIGYSGGATIALMIAVDRTDIASIRTIAGNLSPKLVNEFHNVSVMNNALNPLEISNKIAHIPQVHFYGDKDNVIPKLISERYLKSMSDKHCTAIIEVKDTNHEAGWLESWPQLLNQPLMCSQY